MKLILILNILGTLFGGFLFGASIWLYSWDVEHYGPLFAWGIILLGAAIFFGSIYHFYINHINPEP